MDDVQLAEALVRRAGALATRLRGGGGLAVEHKTSISDLVTAADRAAEQFVVDVLTRVRPHDGIVGEEGAGAPSDSGRTWYIDPVDGTYNFVAGLPSWCSALALTGQDGHTLGAVHAPALDQTWVGGRVPEPVTGPSAHSAVGTVPTTCNGRPVRVSDLALSASGFATYLHPPRLSDPDAVQPWSAMAGGAATLRMLGCGSVDLARVAGGVLGCWAQHSCPAWDWLPGAALVEAAGGVTAVITHRGYTWHLAGGTRAVAELADRLIGS